MALLCLALALPLVGCGQRATSSGSDGALADGTERRSDAGLPDAISAPDAISTPDAISAPDTIADAAVADALLPDAPNVPGPGIDGYLLWQAPGGFAGSGPALEIRPDGKLRLWRSTFTLTPHQTSGWDAEVQLSAIDTGSIFSLLRSTSYANLPHNNAQPAECYPALYFEPCTGPKTCAQPLVKLSYDGADDLRPELDAVYTWLRKRLAATYPNIALPGDYCVQP